ncbi:MAG TPA: succinylglutamate desuccinylase/aspartoacylase family protein [Candidatus Acidoferrales bacterium]|nr:succinylglutamate desuccinylase/aspartoacylase family protein [Candidatus Acidoferrales bacterium]
MRRTAQHAGSLALLLAALPFSAALRAQQGSFTVGTATASAGQKATGYLDVPAGTDAATQIPVVVIRGAKPGPVLAIVSGAHGTEYASILAVEKLIGRLDPAEISGTVVLAPLVNHESFQQIVPHLNPVDKKNMNRFYPGSPDGSQTDRASWVITKQIVERCDFLIDLHGGDLDESLVPYTYWTTVGNERVDATSREMALAFGLNYIIIQSDFPRDPNAAKYLVSDALTRGKPSIIAEAGYAGVSETDDVETLVRGNLNVMRYLKMLPGAAPRLEHPVWMEKAVTVEGEQEGIFYPLVKRGTYVEAGAEVGYVTDYFGKVVQEARAPVAGVVLHICALPTMKKGANIVDIGVIASKAP